MSKWKDTYNRYRDLESNWRWHSFQMRDLFFRANPEKQVAKWRIAGLQIPNPQAIKEALEIRQVIETMPTKYPLEDVYHAALYMVRFYHNWFVDPNVNQVYRGQWCYSWPIIPTLFRGDPTPNKIDSELNRLASLSEALKQEYPQYNEYQRIAIAQHYSKEAYVKTWLVDLTWDPWAALFFASSNGNLGEIGNITCFSRGEWETLSAGGKNRLGAIKLIEAPRVPRMEAQKAVFLDGSHPDLIEQYVGNEIKFHQKDKLIFEDPLIGITTEKLSPEKDTFLTSITKWKKNLQKPTQPLTVKPASDAARPLQPDAYLQIALSWVERRKRSLCPEGITLLKKVCAFHARLQEQKKAVDITARSLRRLDAAVCYILGLPGGEIRAWNLREAVRDYLAQADEDSWLVIMKVLSEIKDSNSY